MASIVKRATGWQVQIRKQGYQNISKRFEKKADAEAWARSIETEMDKGFHAGHSQSKKVTLGEILERYRDEVTPHKLGCREEYSRIKLLLSHQFSARYLHTLKSSDFSAYRDTRLKVVSGTTVNKELNLLNKVIETARREWSITFENHLKGIRRPKNNKARDRRLKEGELEMILNACSTLKHKHIVLFALETAMRRGEIANAKWAHVDWKKQVLVIPQTKTGIPRSIPLSDKAIVILRDLQSESHNSIFGMKSDSLSQPFERACKRINILDLHFHDLRHEATSRLFERGLNPMQVSTITGHKTFEMLKRYTHLKAEDLVKLLN